ncbi:hypothetical protein CL1_1511 [Thermococcus cleftensis]|uniref:Uncharacterized protein n=2 Tax=Thermococcus cleftensis (strain DSM 27260 / KACC 17922 / CL1) TaxID=163003 RepID=I3ZVH6_THECF|nr:hypothetical protein CL1_1511 [Thermococcus cleftensis]
MFIFGGKKEKPRRDIYEELSKKWGLPKEVVKNIGYVYGSPGRGLIKILKSVDPENSEKYAWNALDVDDRGDYIYIRSIEDSEYREKAGREKAPHGVHYPIIHGFLTLAIARKLGNTSGIIGHAVGEALSMWLSRGGYPDIKKNPDQFVDLLATILQRRGMYVDENVKRTIREALEKSTKIADKLIPDVSSVKHLDATSRAIANDAEDPFQILRNAGIDIEPELEEFRQFLAEISGKKVAPKKFPEVEETSRASSKSLIAPELLAIAKGLEFAGYSEEAMKRAEEELWKLIDGLLEDPEENAIEIAYAVKLLRLVQRRDVEGIRNFGG